MYSRCLRTLLFLLCAHCSFAQVINIESKRFLNDTNGWVGKVDINFLLSQNTQQVMQLGNNIHVQYQHNRHRFLLLNDVNFIKAGSTDFVNAGYQHFRYNYKIVDRLTWEAFTQVQYNKVLRLNLRFLSGTGPRFKLLKSEKMRLYIASLYMYEYEEITGVPKPTYTHRSSSYLTFSISIGRNADITSTTFYQPNFADFNDYRIANDSALEIYIGKRLNFKTGFNLLYDTRQPEGIPNLVYSLRNALSFKF
jgi:putative salt-induced outer membrane protein YdiY